MDDTMKRCSKCGEVKDGSEFFGNKRSRSGLRSRCKKCDRECVREYQETHREAVRESARRSYIKNKDRYIQYQWKRELRVRYDMTVDDYYSLYNNQGGKCIICGKMTEAGRKLHVDHDHETGRVRGLLFVQCNVLLGYAKDNPRRLFQAATYLLDKNRFRDKIYKLLCSELRQFEMTMDKEKELEFDGALWELSKKISLLFENGGNESGDSLSQR